MVLGLASIIDCKVWIIILLQLILATTLPIPGRVIRSHRRPKLLFYQKNHFWLVSGLYLAGFVLLFCLMKYILRKRRTCCGFDLQDDAEQQNDAETKDSVTSKHQNNSKVTSSTEQNKSNGDKSKLPETKRTDQAIHTTHEIERDVLMKNEKTLEQDSRHQPVPSVHKKSHSFKTADADMKKEMLVTATVHRILPTDNIKQIPSEYDDVDLMEKGLRSATNNHLPPTKAEPTPHRKSPNPSPAPTMKTPKDTRRNFKSIESELDVKTGVNRYPVNERALNLPRSPRYLNQSVDQQTKSWEENNQTFQNSDLASQRNNRNPQYREFELQYNANNQVENIRHTEKQIEEKPVNRVPLAEIVEEIIARRYRKFLKQEQLKDMCRLEKLARPPGIHNPQTIQPKNVEFLRNDEVVIDMFSQATPGLYDDDIHKQYQNIQTPNNTEKLKINSWSQWSLQTVATRVNRWTQWSRQTLTPENEKWTQCSREPSKDDQSWSYRPESRVTDISYETVVQLDKSTQMSLNGLSTVGSWKYRPESQVTGTSYDTAVQLDQSTQMSLNSRTTVDSWSYRPESQVTDLSYERAVQLDKSTQMSLYGISTVGSWNETESEMDLYSNVSCSHNDKSTQWSIIRENNHIDPEDAESESSSDTSVNTVVNKTNYSQMSTGMSTENLNVKCQYSTESTSDESEKKSIHSSSGEKTLKNNYDEKLSENTYKREIMRHELHTEAEEEPKISKTFDIRSETISAQSYYNLNNHKEKQSDRRFSKDQYEYYQNENDQIKAEYQKEDFNRHENTIHSMPQQPPPTEQDKSSTSNYYNLDGSNFSIQESRTIEVLDINARVNTEDNIKERFSLAQAKETEISSIEVKTSDTHRGSTGTNHITDKEYTAQYPSIDESSRREAIYYKKDDSISNNVIREATIEGEPLETGNNEISAVKHTNGKRRKCLTFCCCCSFKQKDSEKDNESRTETELQEVAKIPEERIERLDDSLAIDSDSETIISAQSIALRKSFINDRIIGRQTSSINSVEASSEIHSCNSNRSSPCTNNLVQQWLAQQRYTDHQANSRENKQSGISSCIRISGRDAADIQEQVESHSSTSMVLSAASNNSANGILDNKLGRLGFERMNTAHHEKRTRNLIGKELKEPYRISYNIPDEVEIFPSSIDKKKESFSQKIVFINSSEKLEKEQKNVATHLEDSLPPHTLDKGTNTKDEFNSNASVTGQDDTKRVETLVCNRVRISFSYQRPRLFRFPRTRRWFNQMRQRWREYRSRNETRDIPVVTPRAPNKSANDIP